MGSKTSCSVNKQSLSCITQIESVVIMLLERLSALEAGFGIRTNNDDTIDEVLASKATNNGIDSLVAVTDNSREKPSKKKRK